jgi:hypothetical protein
MDPRDETLVDEFLNGRCASFAIAAAMALKARGETGVGVSLLFDEDGETNTADGRSAIHAYVSCDRFDADAMGVRTPEDMAEGYDLQSYHVDGPFPPESFDAMFDEDGFVLPTPEWIGIAKELIAGNPELLVPDDQS